MLRRFLAILALAALLPACGHAIIDRVRNPATVTVGIEDTDRTVNLMTGDALVVQLDTPSSTQWRLLSYPKSMLTRETGHTDTGRFVFTATAPGTGRIALMLQPACGKAGGPPCLPSDNPVDGIGGMPPTRPVTFDIRVS